jgi:hypothetical protein
MPAEQTIGAIIAMLEDPADKFAFRLLWHHCGDSRKCQGSAGVPDLLIAGPEGAIWVEVKPRRHRLSPAQTGWWYMLEAAGELHFVWTAEDLEAGTIRKTLEQLL